MKLALYKLLLLLTALVPLRAILTNSLVVCSDRYIEISDFAYHYSLFREYWITTDVFDPYDPAAQRTALQKVCPNSLINQSMPIGLAPVSLLLSYPFSLSPHNYLPIAYLLWTMLSLFALGSGLWLLLTRLQYPAELKLLSLSAILLTPIVSHAIALGQFSIIGVGLLLWLFLLRSDRKLYPLLVLLVLSIKPTYFVFGSIILFTQKSLSRAFLQVILVAFGSYFVLPHLLDTERYYQSISWYLNPEHSGLATDFLTVNQSTLKSVFPHLNLYVTVVAFFGLIGILSFDHNHLILRKTTMASATMLFLATVTPYWGAYDDLIVVVALVPLGGALAARLDSVFWIFCFVVLLSADQFAFRFIGKVLLILMLLYFAIKKRERSPKLSPG